MGLPSAAEESCSSSKAKSALAPPAPPGKYRRLAFIFHKIPLVPGLDKPRPDREF
jgi:hypothetical protein